MVILFFVYLGVIEIRGGRNTRGRGICVERSSGHGNWTCQFQELKVKKGLKNHTLIHNGSRSILQPLAMTRLGAIIDSEMAYGFLLKPAFMPAPPAPLLPHCCVQTLCHWMAPFSMSSLGPLQILCEHSHLAHCCPSLFSCCVFLSLQFLKEI